MTITARGALGICILFGAACSIRDSASDSTRAEPADAPVRTSASADTAPGSITAPQTEGTATFLSARELAKVGDALARGTATARTVEARSSSSIVEARRAGNGEPEVHDCWADVAIVQAGRATLLTGGHVAGNHATGAGEHRGGTISGGTSRVVTTSDVAVIPAGVPHQYLVSAGDSVRYLTVKVREECASKP